MKINRKILTAFIGYLKNSGHGIKERHGCLVFRKAAKDVIIDCIDEDDLSINPYRYQLYMRFMHSWLNMGKSFIRKMQNLGTIIIIRLKGKNHLECWK